MMRAIDPDGMERARARQAKRIRDAIDDDRPDKLLRLHASNRKAMWRLLGLVALIWLVGSAFWLLVWAVSEMGL